jgi:hypothetical protein
MRKQLLWIILGLFLVTSSIVHAGDTSTSGTLASAMITDVRAYLDETTASFWTDTELLQWLNDGMVDLAAKTHCTETQEVVTLVGGTTEYAVTANYIKIKAAIYRDSTLVEKGLIKGNPYSIGNVQNVGEPAYWYEHGGKVGFYPVLAALSGSGTTVEVVRLFLVERPAAIASGTTVSTPGVYDRALTYYILAQAYLKDKQMVKATHMMEMYHKEIALYREDFQQFEQKRTQEVIK